MIYEWVFLLTHGGFQIANSASTQSQQPVQDGKSNLADLKGQQQHSDNTQTGVSHSRTGQAQRCLTSVIARELLFPS